MCGREVLLGLVVSLMVALSSLAVGPDRGSDGGRAAVAGGTERFEFTRLAMGDRVRVVVYTTDEESARRAGAAAFVRIDELESVMTDYREDSELMRLCAASRGGEPDEKGGGGVRVSEDLYGVLDRARRVAEATRGAYDPTIGPVIALWRQARKDGRLPDPAEAANAKERSGFGKLALDASSRTVHLADSDMRLDLGGIGKGYAADAAARVLRGHGIESYLVALGGDIVVGEAPPGEAGWRVNLLGREGEDVLLVRAAVSSSGDTEQFVEIDGKRYSHIVDPRTGMGLTHRTAVVVVAADGATADPMATALSVLGVEEGSRLAAQTPGVEARFVTAGEGGAATHATDGFPAAGEAAYAAHHAMENNRPPSGFVAIFNGRDLTGWEPVAADPPQFATMSADERAAAAEAARAEMAQRWTVEDGTMHLSGEWTSLRTMEEFGSFELLIDWKIAPGGDSGLYLRGCPQVQIWDNPAGSGGLFNNERGGASPRRIADRPIGEWNTFRVVMIGSSATVYLNGELVADRVELENYWDRKGPLPERGPLWLQAHGTPLWFRNIYIRRIGE